MFLSTLLIGVALMSTTGWAQYVLEDDYTANGNFFDQFEFFNGSDPTHGYVDYVERDYAESAGLIGNNYGKIYMGVDHTNVVGKAGRPAVRIESTKTYDSGLIIIDIEHMPGGICGTWPAFWMFGPDWPKNGEIDIVEGVNDQSNNDMTLHTGPGCSISKNSEMLGYVSTDNCDVNASGQSDNEGCQIKTDDNRTYGAGFNNNGGGVYATEITADFINIFFFPRGSIPWDISSASPDPSSWGTPMAVFKGDCDIQKTFNKMSLVFTNTFCGDWAGDAWSSGSCAYKANTCVDYVQYHPEAFEEAYWLVNSLRVYQQGSSYASSEAVSSYSTSRSESYSTPYSESYSTSYSESWSASSTASSTYSTNSSAPSQTATWESTTQSSRKRPHYSAKTQGIAMPSGVSHDPWTASGQSYSATATFVPETSEDAGEARYIVPSETIDVASVPPTGIAEQISHESRQRPEGWASRGQRPHNRDSERAAEHLKQHKRRGHGGRRL